MIKHWGLIAVSAIALAACDVVRVPGDGRQAPDPKPVIPDGAPGPAPPTIPVTDPWGEGEDATSVPISDTTPIEDSTDTSGADTPDEDPVTDTEAADQTPLEDREPVEPTVRGERDR